MPKSIGNGGKSVSRYMQAQLLAAEKDCAL
jgi:hypothetical protein